MTRHAPEEPKMILNIGHACLLSVFLVGSERYLLAIGATNRGTLTRRPQYTLDRPGVPAGGSSPACLQSSSPGVIAGAAASFGGCANAGRLKLK